MSPLLKKTFDALSSMWLSITVLGFLFVLTVLGTLEQTRTSLFEVQRRYFDSVFVMHEVAGVPVPLPGVRLLLIVLFVNLVCGGLVRIRKSSTTWGVIVAHVGIAAMLVGSAIEFSSSQKGHATIAEGATTAEFQSYYDWEIAVAESRTSGPVTEFVIPGDKFMHRERVTFSREELPFDVEVHGALANCAPRSDVRGVDGVTLMALPREREAEQDAAGAYVTVRPKDGSAPVVGVVWARERGPMTFATAGRRFTLEMSHRRWPLPFAVQLQDFRRELYPGTGMPKAFESDVLKIEDGVPQRVRISMNEPLRQSGYTLYQSGFIEPSGGNTLWRSTFSVVRNPADDVPLWSCLVMTAGLLLHFAQKLVRHVRTQRWRQA